ncbi:hypothetical protein [Alkalihalobacillus pseudalcaliphilus]|uniref:hypothetical protein n=1 Tax=Alkalihalobacillus pseudalcaliphilus TaxID=79884 RepID=UPI000A7AC847
MYASIKQESINYALSQQFKKDINYADFQTTEIHGGTVGNVYLVTGSDGTADGEKMPYRIVLKIQKKW